MNWFWIFIGGGLGSVTRYGMAAVMAPYSDKFPLNTLGANFLASLILGFGIYFLSGKDNQVLPPLLLIGFCGGFSTFSTFALDTVQLLKAEHLLLAFLNVLVSVILCVGVVWFLVKRI